MATGFCLSFRGAASDEESRTAFENIQSEIPRFARNDSLNEVVTQTLVGEPEEIGGCA